MNSYVKKLILIIIYILFPVFVFIGFIFYENSSYYSSKEILYFVKAAPESGPSGLVLEETVIL